jgi:amino acid transporter
MSVIIFLATGLGLFLSAESLIVLGNGVGRTDAFFLVGIAIAAGIHLLGAYHLFGRFSGPADEIGLLRRTLGPTTALAAPIAARVSVTILAATALLARAGYVFSEVFVFGFPNFLFTFIFLALITTINLAGRDMWQGFQVAAMLATVGGLGALIVAGSLLTPQTAAAPPPPVPVPLWPATLLYAALLPIGYDLALLAAAKGAAPSPRGPVVVIVLGGLLLILWGMVSLRWVPQAALADTTIPYTIVARAMLDQTGRIIAGVLILGGIGAAVNALFGGVSRMLQAMSSAGLLPAVMGAGRFKGRLPVLVLAAATTAMLLAGMAGSEHLAVYLRTGLIVWLLYYALLHLAALISGRHDRFPLARRAAHALGALVLGLVGALLLTTASEAATSLIFFSLVIASGLILGHLFTRWPRRVDRVR